MTEVASTPESVRVVEVGLRDGLQSFERIVATNDKLRILEALVGAGIRHLELGSFVRPDLVPEMADSNRLFEATRGRWPDVELIALVPNRRGAELAVEAGARSLRMVLSATEGHSHANTGRTVKEGLREAAAVARYAQAEGVALDVGIATSFVCPFDGAVAPSHVVNVVETLLAAGYRVIGLADTLGRANPAQVSATVAAIRSAHPVVDIGIHLHNTYGMGIANAVAALDVGVRRFDAAIGGIGGCPFAPGALGNIATEELVLLLGDLGYDAGVSLDTLGEALRTAYAVLDATPVSSVSRVLGWATG